MEKKIETTIEGLGFRLTPKETSAALSLGPWVEGLGSEPSTLNPKPTLNLKP